MKYEQPGKGRATIAERGNKVEIRIPSNKNWFIGIFLGAWLGGWLFGEIMVLTLFLPSVVKAGAGVQPLSLCFG